MRKVFELVGGKVVECAREDGPLLVYINPDETERRFLIDTLKIDEHTLTSTLDPDELARLELEPSHLAIIFKRPRNYSFQDQLSFKVSSIGLFLFRERLVAVMPDDASLFDGKPFGNLQSLRDLTLRILSRMVQHFIGHLKVINSIAGEIEERIEKSVDNSSLLQMFSLEKSLVYYINAIHANGGVIDRLKINSQNPATAGFHPTDVEFIDDLLIENRQCYESAMIYSNILASLMDARASIISNNLNVMMKNLNALVIAVAVPSFFAGMGGMSEFSAMIGFDRNWRLGYGMFLLVMLLIGVLIFLMIQHPERWRRKR